MTSQRRLSVVLAKLPHLSGLRVGGAYFMTSVSSPWGAMATYASFSTFNPCVYLVH